MGSFAKHFSLFLLCAIISTGLLLPNSRINLATLVNPDGRHVLATLPFTANNNEYKIIKLRKGSSIAVEIYKTKPGTLNSELQAVFDIPDSKDVFYDFKSSLSNLFEANIDEDPATEIIVPVMDNNLVARLNVIKYEPKSQQFSYHSP
jgi:hypothetical protein